MKNCLACVLLIVILLTCSVAFADGSASLLKNPPTIPSGTMSADSVDFVSNKTYAVYSAPNSKSVRGANGRAKVSTNGWVQVFGRENDWVLVQYAISDTQCRIGYIRNPELVAKTALPHLNLTNVPALMNVDADLTDDPLMSQNKLMTVTKDTKVSCLGILGDWSYVETSLDDKRIRGFVPTSTLYGIVASETEAYQAMMGSWRLYAGDSVIADRITFFNNGTMLLQNTTTHGEHVEWNGTWTISPYDIARKRYWNEPEFELVLMDETSTRSYGLRICRRPSEQSRYSYALILTDDETKNSAMLCE